MKYATFKNNVNGSLLMRDLFICLNFLTEIVELGKDWLINTDS